MSIVEMRVHMDCPGCERKIRKALSKLDGVNDIDIDMNMQKVTVTGWADQNKVMKTVRKTGRTVEPWPFPYNPEYHDYTYYYYGQNYGSPTNYNYSGQTSVYNDSTDYNTVEQQSRYNYHNHGYYQPPPSTAIMGERPSALFSDDNATGCTVM